MNNMRVARFWRGILGQAAIVATFFTAQSPAGDPIQQTGLRPAGVDLALHAPALLSDDQSFGVRGRLAGAAGSQQMNQAETMEMGTGWTLDGPYFLRSADPEPPGVLDLKLVYGFETSSDEEDEHEVEFVVEWGMAKDIEFILESEVEVGDGKVEGNGDISRLGLHTRFWEEDGWLPAFAMRNLVRVPTGYESDGVDYLGRGLFTKTIIPDTLRAHFNPFILSINGNLEEEDRHLRWGAALGVDYRVNDDLLFIADYMHQSSEEEGARNQHSLELGADWEFAEGQELGLQSEFELDGDESGPNFGCRISYILEIPAPRLDRG